MKPIIQTLLILIFSLKLYAQIPDPCTGAGASQPISILSPCNCTEAQSGTPCNKTSFATKVASDAAINFFLTTQSNYALPTSPTNWQDLRSSIGAGMNLNGTFKHEFCTEVTTGISTNKLNILNIAQVQINCNAVCQDYKIIKKTNICGTNAITPTLIASALNPTVFYRQYVVSPNTTYIICRQLYFDGFDFDCYSSWIGGDGINSLGAQVTAQHWFYYEEAIVTPVIFQNLNIIKVNDKNLINWNTVSESNILKYEIEKSKDGSNFSILGTLASYGNSNSLQNYWFEDQDATKEICYYRIKIVATDGKISYSPIIKTNRQTEKIRSLMVFPNPVKNNTTILFESNQICRANYTITATNGQTIQSGTLPAQKGINKLNLDLQALGAGTYFYTIQLNKQTLSAKIIKE